MSYDFVNMAFDISYYVWFPLMSVLLAFLMIKVLKKVMPKLEKMKSVNSSLVGITVLVYSIPAILLFIVLLLPLFYFNHQTKQYDYCMQVVRVNNMTSPDDSMLQERCSQFDLIELINRAYADV